MRLSIGSAVTNRSILHKTHSNYWFIDISSSLIMVFDYQAKAPKTYLGHGIYYDLLTEKHIDIYVKQHNLVW